MGSNSNGGAPGRQLRRGVEPRLPQTLRQQKTKNPPKIKLTSLTGRRTHSNTQRYEQRTRQSEKRAESEADQPLTPKEYTA